MLEAWWFRSLFLLCLAATISAQIVGYWTWIGGSQSSNARSVYGTKGVPAATTFPGARREPLTWVDSNDNIYMYGGYMNDFRLYYHSDMWRYKNGQWAWIFGANCSTCLDRIYPVYGTKGVPSDTNRPGARCCSCTWTDNQNNLWLFGGQSVDAGGRLTFLNDLWKWDGSVWTWLGGSTQPSIRGVYGQKGVPDAANMPGARVDGQCWGDNNGHFWVYGGLGYAASGTYGELSDLWKFDHSNWIWMNGSSTTTSYDNFGQKGVTAASNTPGSRYDSVGWADSNGNFWQFGGMHNNDEYNDLWKFDGNLYWTWITGDDNPDGSAVYGTPGFGAPQNTPGPRAVSSGHVDRTGRLWLFGGTLRDSSTFVAVQYNDLWVYDTTSGYWTWVSGSKNANANATWGPLGQGTPYGVLAARHSAGMWIDSKNTVYIFGGGIGYSTTSTSYNDFWTFTLGPAPPTAAAATTTTTTTTTTTGPTTTGPVTTGQPGTSGTPGTTSSGSSGGDSHDGGLTAGLTLVGVNILLFDLAIVAAVIWYVMKRRQAAAGAAGPSYAPVSLVDNNDDV